MLTCLWRAICPENLLMHEEGMVFLLSDTRTHLPEAPGHPFLRAVLTEKIRPPAPSAAPNKCNSPVIAMATDQMARNSKHWFPSSSGGWKFKFNITGLKSSIYRPRLWGKPTSSLFLVSNRCLYALACSPFPHLHRPPLAPLPSPHHGSKSFSVSLINHL